MAMISISSRFERAFLFGYDVLLDSLPEISVPLLINDVKGYRTTVVTEIDDSLDGLAPYDAEIPDYLKITVYMSWFKPEIIADSASLYFTPQRSWSN